MASPHCEKTPFSKLEIESVQTVPPFRPTDPRQTRQVSVEDPVGSGIFQRCFNVVLYFKKVEEDSGWKFAGWIKESLGRALAEEPTLSGRLRRVEDGNGPGLEIVSNDSGLRLIEAKIPVTLEEFFGVNESNKAELVFWKDVDEQNPQFSPLCYVQVTNFECGGYSVGISCNILLADLLIMGNFLKNWAHIHRDIVSKDDDALKTPIFYLPNLKNTSSPPAIPIISSNQGNNCGQTMIFQVTDKTVLDLENDLGKTLMLYCVEAAERELGSDMASKFPVFLKESPNVLKIESCLKLESGLVQSQLNLGSHVSAASWDDLGGNDIVFKEGNKPTRVTFWIGSVAEGLVMAFTSPEEASSGLNIIVSIAKEDKNI